MFSPMNKIISVWNKLLGSEALFSMENRLYNLVCIIALTILLLLLGNGVILHLWQSALITFVVLILQAIFYYYARFKKRFTKSIMLNGAVSYVALIFNFFVNSGSYGPTLFVFFLTLNLLIAITPNKMHIVWMMLHIISVCSLLIIEWMYPQWILNDYANLKDRTFDIAYTYIISLVFTYLIVRYLRNYLSRQKQQTEAAILKLKAVFESSDNCHIFLDRKMRILYFNRGSADFIDRMYKKTIFNEEDFRQFVNPKYERVFEQNFMQVLQGETIKEVRLLTYPNKEDIWWHISLMPVIDELENIIGVSFIASDITDAKLQQENIHRKNESLMKIAHIQSHEIRTPVVDILSIINLIKMEGYDNIAEYMPMMEQAALDLDNKIKQIVDQTNAAIKFF
jgi:PAS domain S-box-containing protein